LNEISSKGSASIQNVRKLNSMPQTATAAAISPAKTSSPKRKSDQKGHETMYQSSLKTGVVTSQEKLVNKQSELSSIYRELQRKFQNKNSAFDY